MVRTSPGKEDQFEELGVQELAEFSYHWIRLVAIVLAAVIGYLEMRDVHLERFTKAFDNTSLIKIGLFMYFVAWGWGVTDDTRIQRRAYLRDPGYGHVSVREWLAIFVFLVSFATLFVIPNYPGWFQLALLIFIIVNFWTWRVVFHRTTAVIDATYRHCTAGSGSKNLAALAKLLLVVEYMNGPWQRRRFGTLIALAASQVPIAFIVSSGKVGPYILGTTLYGVHLVVLVGYIPGLLFIVWVLTSEIWIKIFRVRIFSDLTTIDWIYRHFTLAKQRDSLLPRPHMVDAFDSSPTSNQNYSATGPLRWFTRKS